jgi:hypothetical protein
MKFVILAVVFLKTKSSGIRRFVVRRVILEASKDRNGRRITKIQSAVL